MTIGGGAAAYRKVKSAAISLPLTGCFITACEIQSARNEGVRLKGVTDEVIAEVRSRAAINEVIAEYVVLKRSGKGYMALCPFHKEKSGSFSVSPDRGIYKCFGCGELGDVFKFIQKYKGLGFIDAVRFLAEKYGVALVETEEERHQYDKRTTILMLHQQAAEYFSHLLADPIAGQIARDYLAGRGITNDIIEKFKLGYAPNSWDGLLRYLTSNTKVTPQTLEEAGLVRKRSESDNYYDVFRHRLMVPIYDEQGRVIAFGGRTLGDDQVKYLNSPETPIYSKSSNLFALYQAKESIKKKDAVVVVEGYFDAITSHLYGFDNTVAVCGATLTEHQARALLKYTESKRVYLGFDADGAGLKAVESGSLTLNQIAEGIGLDLRVLRVPGGKDPDECLRMKDGDQIVGPIIYAKAMSEAPTLLEFQLNTAIEGIDLGSHVGKIDAAKKLVPVFSQIRIHVARGEYIRQWSMKLGIPEENLLSDVRQYMANHRRHSPPEPSSSARARAQAQAQAGLASPSKHLISTRGFLMSGYVNAEQQLLALYLTSRDDYDIVYRHLEDEVFINAPHQRIKEAIEGIGTDFHTIEDLHSQLLDRLGPDVEAHAAFVEVILKAETLRKQNLPVEKIIHEFRVVILKERITRKLGSLRSALATIETDADFRDVQSKIIQLNNIEKLALTRQDLSLDEIADLKRKIDDIGGTSEVPVKAGETA
jgi:DNA primase